MGGGSQWDISTILYGGVTIGHQHHPIWGGVTIGHQHHPIWGGHYRTSAPSYMGGGVTIARHQHHPIWGGGHNRTSAPSYMGGGVTIGHQHHPIWGGHNRTSASSYMGGGHNICIWYSFECEMASSGIRLPHLARVAARLGPDEGVECQMRPSRTRMNAICIFSHKHHMKEINFFQLDLDVYM